jgi:hypothetical protein
MPPEVYLIKQALVGVGNALAEAIERERAKELGPELSRKQLEEVRDYRDVAHGSPFWRGLGGGVVGGGVGAGLGVVLGSLVNRPGVGAAIGGGLLGTLSAYGGATSPRRARETLEGWRKDPMVTFHDSRNDIDDFDVMERPATPEAKAVLKLVLRELSNKQRIS